MKKIILLTLALAIAAGVGGYFLIRSTQRARDAAAEEFAERMARAEERAAVLPVPLPKPDLRPGTENYPFEVFVETQLQTRARSFQDATDYARSFINASVVYRKTNEVVWDNFLAFNVFYEFNRYAEFDTFGEAVAFAENRERAFIYYRRNNVRIWSNIEELPAAHRIENVPMILQNPELPRGCEVTSLAMLLQFHGVRGVTKTDLADRVNKDETPHRREGGRIYAGNPNTGFVGDMTNMQNFGYGVYHGPIYELARYYRPTSTMNLTGAYFDALQRIITMNRPVWIITNATHRRLPDSDFETWITPLGEISITRWQHSVLITGYDEDFIYFNDPLSGARSMPRNDFIMAWEQMGRQVIALAE
ncbi:MAG: C39 family peptidase [Defluviitaleaceae bacterium]|nr:C39 family peptidase [Defluviitaleaceae bacterium]